MALEDIVMIADDIVEPISEIPQGTLNPPQDQISDHMMNELTLVLEASYSS
jgi:hypothetical protein